MPVHGISSDDLVGRNIEKEQLLDFLNVNLPSLCQQKAGACNETGNEYTASGDDSADGDRDGPSPSAARAHRAKAMYISGSPGTGKTALLSHVLERLQAQQADQLLACSAMGKGKAALGTAVQTRTAFLNCASIAVGKKEEIWMRLADALGFDMAPTKGKTECAGQQAFERQLQKSGNPRW
jgi:Cdc6-like AAA superfamily ATPase